MIRAWSVALVGAMLLFPLVGAMDARRPEPPDVLETLPPPALLPILAFGQRESASDLLELRAVQFLTKTLATHSRLDRDHLWALYGAIMILDPENVPACYRGAMFLSSLADDPAGAIRMMSLSLGEEDPRFPLDPEDVALRVPASRKHPGRWKLYHEQAAVYFLMLRNRTNDPELADVYVRRAGELWLLAGEEPGAPEWFTMIGRKLSSTGLTPLDAMDYEVRLWNKRAEEASSEEQRERALGHLGVALSGWRRAAIQVEVDALRAQGVVVKTIAELRALPRLRLKPDAFEDPLGVGFFLDVGETGTLVVAPGYDAAHIRARAEDLYRTWIAIHPEKTPTREDFPILVKTAPPHVIFDIGPEGPIVRGVLPR